MGTEQEQDARRLPPRRFLALASAHELTPDNYDELTSGKTVFIKFQAPW